jgi:hypothetical protein
MEYDDTNSSIPVNHRCVAILSSYCSSWYLLPHVAADQLNKVQQHKGATQHKYNKDLLPAQKK